MELKITKEKRLDTIKKHPETEDVLESLLPEIVEKTYKIGDIYRITTPFLIFECILAQIYTRKVVLIDLCDGNRFSEPIEINDPLKITGEELRKILGIDHNLYTLTKIEWQVLQ